MTADGEETIRRLLAGISGEEFKRWYSGRRRARSPGQHSGRSSKENSNVPPGRHAPSRLLQCHRKTLYRVHDAPEESQQRAGIFWFSTHLETELVVPFLEARTDADVYVRNSIWVDYTRSTDEGPLQIRGRTDPVLVDVTGQPLVLTEVKTTASVHALDAPRSHHLAQAHAYMEGLSEHADQDVRETLLLYFSRETLDARTFTVEFDDQFWEERVLPWAAQNSEYRRRDELPPARPEFDWECDYCSFRHRCGRADSPYADTGPHGFLPLFDEYPRERVREYLDAVPNARLTPTLAHAFPGLIDRYGVLDWGCQRCSATYAYDAVEWDGDTEHPPLCEACCRDGVPAPLSGPPPADQHRSSDQTDRPATST